MSAHCTGICFLVHCYHASHILAPLKFFPFFEYNHVLLYLLAFVHSGMSIPLLDKLVFILQNPVKWDFSCNVSYPFKMNYFLLPLGFHSTFYSFSAPGHLSYHLVMIYIPCIFFSRLLTIRWHSLFICFCIFGSQYTSWHRACSQ